MATLLSRLDEILRDVDMDAWSPLISMELLTRALTAIGSETVAPPPALIFEPLRYGRPEDFHTVIIGQDPYPTPGDAQGLCFSVGGGSAPPDSLKRIFGCLDRAGLRAPHVDSNGVVMVSSDLRSWAVQGVLMINTAFTTTVGVRRGHAAIWKPFFANFLTQLCDEGTSPNPYTFLLWGNDARAYAKTAESRGHRVLVWSHPSPMADNKLPDESKFAQCPHFELVNAGLKERSLRPVIWDNLTRIVAFTDGSCPLNGKPNARASFGVVIMGAQFGAATIHGEIHPAEYEFIDASRPEMGVRANGQQATPTNNRGELLAIIYCLLGLLRGRAVSAIEIVSDSQISVNTLLDWLPNRLKKGTERALKNFDLVMLAWTLLERLRAQASEVKITHVRSHQKAPPSTATSREKLLWKGNDMADRAADEAMAGPSTYRIEVLKAPAILRGLATIDEVSS
jgi:uracil-DNA glycosylase